ncbi:phage tail tape measure protein (plasmid) [Entomospira entomophila]|uniref:Phage tail tape measure protein n=1 Tax=Entomospira entomophila TaxID=2719988 RepID=A0A968KUI3_9SPIO|nr:phage tail tape measure protein [Entomospira entomophilus]NIZ41506.1 phage tail tape measure protein [Entomospira entomophilus]WDI36410.1 phage tail tape measure protein [Entomospira entomophilus]
MGLAYDIVLSGIMDTIKNIFVEIEEKAQLSSLASLDFTQNMKELSQVINFENNSLNKEYKKYEDLAKKISLGETGDASIYSITEIVEAMIALAKFDFNGGLSESNIQRVTTFATAGDFTMSQATDIIGKIGRMWDIKDIHHITSMMGSLAKNTNMSLQMIADAMIHMGEDASHFGMSLPEASGALHSLARYTNLRGEKGAHALTKLLKKLSDNQVIAKLENLGIEVIDPRNNQQHAFEQIMYNIRQAELNSKDLLDIFGEESLGIFNALSLYPADHLRKSIWEYRKGYDEKAINALSEAFKESPAGAFKRSISRKNNYHLLYSQTTNNNANLLRKHSNISATQTIHEINQEGLNPYYKRPVPLPPYGAYDYKGPRNQSTQRQGFSLSNHYMEDLPIKIFIHHSLTISAQRLMDEDSHLSLLGNTVLYHILSHPSFLKQEKLQSSSTISLPMPYEVALDQFNLTQAISHKNQEGSFLSPLIESSLKYADSVINSLESSKYITEAITHSLNLTQAISHNKNINTTYPLDKKDPIEITISLHNNGNIQTEITEIETNKNKQVFVSLERGSVYD